MTARSAFTVSRSNRTRSVAVRFQVQASDFGARITSSGSADLTSDEARALAAALSAQADATDLKAQKQDAAGRMRVFSARDFL